MALLDVSEILTDPDFIDTTLVCERSAQTVNGNGMAINAITYIPFAAVVTADQGDLLTRIETGQRIQGNITLHTRFSLRDGASGYIADVVQWRGKRYTVSSVFDYLNWGQGFVQANCDIIPLAGS